MSVFLRFASLALLTLLASANAVFAQLPAAQLFQLDPPVVQIGEPTKVRVRGADLEDARAMVFADANVSAKPTETAGEFTVLASDGAGSGAVDAWVVGRFGASNPRRLMLAHGPVARAEENGSTPGDLSAATLGGWATGAIDAAGDLDHFKVRMRRGERVVIRALAEQIDSRLHPAIRLYNSAGHELGAGFRYEGLDPILDFTAPADDDYTLLINDVLYRGGADYFYAIEFRVAPYLDMVWPPAVGDSFKPSRVYGRNLPDGKPSDLVSADGIPLETMSVTHRDVLAGLRPPRLLLPSSAALSPLNELQLKTPWGETNGVLASPAVGTIELADEEPESGGLIELPHNGRIEIDGRFNGSGDLDRYLVRLAPNTAYRIEVVSQRLGAACDPYLQVYRGEAESRELVAEADDDGRRPFGREFNLAHRDPAVALRTNEEGDAVYQIEVGDHGSVRDPRLVYRLLVTPARPDFALLALPRPAAPDRNDGGFVAGVSGAVLRQGGTATIDVYAERSGGLGDEVTLEVIGLPDFVQVSGAVVSAGTTRATLVLSAADDAPAWSGAVQVVGRAAGLEHTAAYGTLAWPASPNASSEETPRARLMQALPVSVVAHPAPASLQGPPEVAVAVGGFETATVQLARSAGEGKLTISAVSAPAGVEVKQVEAEPGEVELEITAKGDAAPAEGAVVLVARGAVEYQRIDPRKIAEAKGQVEMLGNKLSDLEASLAAGKATVAAAEAEEKTLAEAAAAAAPAVEEARATESAAQTEFDAALEALEAAKQRVAESGAALASKRQARELAVAGLEEAEALRAAAATRRDEATALIAELEPQLEPTRASAAEARRRWESLAEAGKPKSITANFASPAVRVVIASAPLELSVGGGRLTASAGQSIELPLTVRRTSGFTGSIALAATATGDGVTISEASVAGDASDATLAIEVGAAAQPGARTIAVKATCQFAEAERTAVLEVPLLILPGE